MYVRVCVCVCECRGGDGCIHIFSHTHTNTHLSAALHELIHVCEKVLHLCMLCVCTCLCVCACVSQHSWKGAAAFPPECDCQWASLSLAVWQDARIISGHGGSERGSRMEESKGGKGREGL